MTELVVSGADLVTSVGAGVSACFEALCAGRSGNRPLQSFARERFRIARCYEIPDRAADGGDTPGRASAWLRRCVAGALEQAGPGAAEARVALLVGTGLRELRGLELWWDRGLPFEPGDLHFAGALRDVLPDAPPALTLSNACSASSFVLGLGADLLELGQADAVVVAGCDSITESMLGMLDRVSVVPPEHVEPFERARRGVLLGEGAAAVVLESAERCRARGARPLALLRGVGMSCDAHHETAPWLEGIVASMADAHRRAGVTPDEIDLVLAHGTGTALSDPVEAAALRQVFGAAVERVRVTALKSMLGHTSGASGLMSVIVAIEALRQGRVPPTLGLRDPIEEAAGLDIVTGDARRATLRLAQVNAFGFGGVNAVVVLERGAP